MDRLHWFSKRFMSCITNQHEQYSPSKQASRLCCRHRTKYSFIICFLCIVVHCGTSIRQSHHVLLASANMCFFLFKATGYLSLQCLCSVGWSTTAATPLAAQLPPASYTFFLWRVAILILFNYALFAVLAILHSGFGRNPLRSDIWTYTNWLKTVKGAPID